MRFGDMFEEDEENELLELIDPDKFPNDVDEACE